jgi:hypothetical protein
MKTALEKQMSTLAKEAGTRPRSKKRTALFGTKDVWRALSSASLSLHTPILRRLRD